jgi:hypothetical protein
MSGSTPHKQDDDAQTPVGRGVVLVRYVLPAAAVVAGAIVMSLGSEADLEGGAGIVGAGIAIFAVNLLIRASTAGDREQRARDFFDAHGHWPDESSTGRRRPGA